MSQLTKAQRYTISVMRKQNFPMGEIAAAIGKHKSTISRELRRNCDGRSGRYDADLAQRKCERRQKGKPHRVRFTEEVRLRVEAMLREDYSPDRLWGVAGWRGLNASAWRPYTSMCGATSAVAATCTPTCGARAANTASGARRRTRGASSATA